MAQSSSVPTPLSDAWRLDALGLVEAYREQSLDPVEVLGLFRERIERLDPVVNAFACLSPDAAGEAEASADRWKRGAPLGPLDGVPVALKDNLVARGMPASFGSRLFADHVQTHDELPVERLRKAGAIVIGKTTTPEFAVEGYTASDRFGVTRNPFDVSLTPGGSSGGSVAAMAAGLAPLALGTDGGGSTRRPAAYTGLFGFKPGLGHVPRADGLPQVLLDFEVVGTFARSARDAILVDRVMSGADRSDPTSRMLVPQPVKTGPLTIRLVERIDGNPCDPAIVEALHDTAKRLDAMGHEIVMGDLPVDVSALGTVWSQIAEIGLARLAETHPRLTSLANPKYVQMAERGARRSASDLLAILEIVASLRRQALRAFAAMDMILMPACAAMPWAADEPFPTHIDGQAVGPRGHAVYTGWVNAAGLPAMTLPCPVSPGALPIGMQLIADRGAEALILALASDYETRHPWSSNWPDLAGR